MDGSSRKLTDRRSPLAVHLICSWIACSTLAFAQSPDDTAAESSAQQSASEQITADQPAASDKKKLTGAALRDYMQKQLSLLDNASYRERELARFRLQQYPYAAIVAILESAPTASVNSTSQQIDLLDGFSTHPDVAISAAAYDVLKEFSAASRNRAGQHR